MRLILEPAIRKLIPKEVWGVFETFAEKGFEIYLVGAGVRNLLWRKTPVECDFTTSAPPEEIRKLFPKSYYNNAFGTVGIPIQRDKTQEIYEITTYRKEWGYTDRRRPDSVAWSESLEEDLKRREFTVSAMVVGPISQNIKHKTWNNESLELIDLFDGIKDFKNKVIRAVGNPTERFAEDALRMIRAIRFASQLGFTIEEETFAGIKNNAPLIIKISGERVRDELFKILKSDHPADGFTLLFSSGLLEQIMPELTRGYGIKQAKHHIYDVWTHSLLSLKFCPAKDPLVRLATLLHDAGKPVVARGEGEKRTFYDHEVIGASISQNIGRRIRLSKKELEKLVTLIRWHQFTCDERQTDSAIRRFIRNVGKENLQDMLDLRVGDRLGGGARETSWRLEKFKQRLVEVQKQPFAITDLKVNGNDVMKALGIAPGPVIGRILEKLFEEVVEDKKKNKRPYLLKRIKEIRELL